MDDEARRVTVAAWDGLHAQARFRPVYPSESVVRFVSRRFGGLEGVDQPMDLLDVGCGAGRHTLLMSRAGHRVSATDVSAQGLTATRDRLAAEGLEANLQLAPMTELPFGAHSFAGVVSYGVFLYGDAATFAGAVAEAHRVLVPGGRLLVVTRSVRDDRFALGPEVEPGTVRLESDATNEAGLLMHFLDDARTVEYFRDFSEVEVDRIDHTVGGGTFLNADLVIEATK